MGRPREKRTSYEKAIEHFSVELDLGRLDNDDIVEEAANCIDAYCQSEWDTHNALKRFQGLISEEDYRKLRAYWRNTTLEQREAKRIKGVQESNLKEMVEMLDNEKLYSEEIQPIIKEAARYVKEALAKISTKSSS